MKSKKAYKPTKGQIAFRKRHDEKVKHHMRNVGKLSKKAIAGYVYLPKWLLW